MYLKLIIVAVCITIAVAGMPASLRNIFLNKHNYYRSRVPGRKGPKLPNVKWDNNLEKYATDYIQKLARTTCRMKHSTNNQRKNIRGWKGKLAGENLAYRMDTRMKKNNMGDMQKSARAANDAWYNEIRDYNINTGKCKPGKVCGHYTQMVWDTSTKIGCGVAVCTKVKATTYMVACVYEPAGNSGGQKPYNRAKCQNSKVRKGNIQTEIICKGSCTTTKVTTYYPSGAYSWKSSTKC